MKFLIDRDGDGLLRSRCHDGRCEFYHRYALAGGGGVLAVLGEQEGERDYVYLHYSPVAYYPVAVLGDDRIEYVHTDQLFGEVYRTDAEGAVTGTFQQDPFGELRSNSLTYPVIARDGQLRFSDDEVLDNLMRIYLPKLGRFAQPDPLRPVQNNLRVGPGRLLFENNEHVFNTFSMISPEFVTKRARSDFLAAAGLADTIRPRPDVFTGYSNNPLRVKDNSGADDGATVGFELGSCDQSTQVNIEGRCVPLAPKDPQKPNPLGVSLGKLWCKAFNKWGSPPSPRPAVGDCVRG